MTTASISTALPRATTRPRWQRLALATLAAAVGDAAFAFVTYVLVAGRYNFESLLQYIASGLAGHSAFASGWAGVGYAALGFAIHLALSAGFTVVFAITVAPRINSRTAVIVSGLLYGVAIWLFMNAVVLPLGRSTHEKFFDGYYIAFLIDHALLVGLPIALLVAAGARPVRRDTSQGAE